MSLFPNDIDNYMNGEVPFRDNPNIEQIHEYLFIYKNFLNQETIDKYTETLNNLSDSDWRQPYSNSYWSDKASPEIIGNDIHKPVMDLLSPIFWTYRVPSFYRLRQGQEAELQTPDNYYGKDGQRIIGHYKLAIYLGEFEGGEICFPDVTFEYKPNPGDLVIFKIHPHLNHYTKPVLSGNRYVYADLAIFNLRHFMP
jgi:hypothetical protein